MTLSVCGCVGGGGEGGLKTFFSQQLFIIFKNVCVGGGGGKG